MITPDSHIASEEVTVLGSTIKRSRDTGIMLNVGAGIFLAAWIAAHFIYPLPVLGWMALGFFALAHLHQLGRSLIDHHAAINTLIPLELQLAQIKAVSAARQQAQEASGAMHPASKVAPSGAMGISGRKVN